MKKHSVSAYLAGILALLGLFSVVRILGEVFQYRYFHIVHMGNFVVSMLLLALMAGLCIWLGIKVFSGYPGSSYALLIGLVLFLFILVIVLVEFVFGLPTAVESKTTAVENYGRYDKAVVQYLEGEEQSDFLPRELPEGAACEEYAYTFRNAMRETFTISATVSFESEAQFRAEVERLESLPEKETDGAYTWAYSEENRTVSYSVSCD